MQEVQEKVGDIERALEKLKQWQTQTNIALNNLDRADLELIKELTSVLKDQATNNLEYGKLLNDLSVAVASLAFEVEELKRWQKLVSGKSPSWITEHRAEQSRMAFQAVKDSFNDNEFLELIMNTGIPMAEISGDSISEKALWLIDYSRRNGLFWKVVKEGRMMRPNALWPVETGRVG